jgi:hypothetical protein
MTRRPEEDEVDRLYQLPLAEFVAARHALARRRGPRGAPIKRLPKPSLPAWAVNQLYWQQRQRYQDVIDRAADLRATHAAAARGRATDIRSAGRAHEEAVERALKATLALVAAAGHPVSDATRQAIATTLRGLPAGEPPGRLSRAVEPRGFEALAAAAAGGRVRLAARVPAATPAREARAAKGRARSEPSTDEAERLALAQAAEEAGRTVRDAEQALRRDQFEAARAAREADRAERRLQQARDALEEAQAELEDAARAATAAASARDAAESRAGESETRLAVAREAERSARDAARPRARTLGEP